MTWVTEKEKLAAYSQGGVKVPTGGDPATGSPRAPFVVKRVSRSGVIPEPTVIVRMEENMAVSRGMRVPGGLVCCTRVAGGGCDLLSCALILANT